MQIQIITTEEQFKSLIADAIQDFITHYVKVMKDDRDDSCTIEGAIEETGLSRSKIYKLTSTNQIPCKKFGQKLVFSRKALRSWKESQTI